MKNKHHKKDRDFLSLVITLIFVIFFFLALLPVIFDFSSASTVGKIFMILGSVLCLIFISSIFAFSIRSNRKNKDNKTRFNLKDILAFIVMLLAELYLVLRYIHPTIWGTYNTGKIVFLWLFNFFGVHNLVSSLFGNFLNKEKLSIFIFALSVLLLLVGLDISENTVASTILIQIAIGVFYLFAMSIFLNLTVFSKKNQTSNHIVLKSCVSIFLSFAILVSLPFYINWCGLFKNSFDQFVTIYSAIVGGGLTLVGVLLSIRHTAETRKLDLLESYKPIIRCVNFSTVDATTVQKLCFYASPNTIHKHLFYAELLNTDKASFNTLKLCVGDTFIPVSQIAYIKKGEPFIVSCHLTLENTNTPICLVVQDDYGTTHTFSFSYSLNENSDEIHATDINEIYN